MTNNFTDEQKALIRETAREVLGEVLPDFLDHHEYACRHGLVLQKWINRSWGVVIGLSIASGLMSGGIVYWLAQLMRI